MNDPLTESLFIYTETLFLTIPNCVDNVVITIIEKQYQQLRIKSVFSNHIKIRYIFSNLGVKLTLPSYASTLNV